MFEVFEDSGNKMPRREVKVIFFFLFVCQKDILFILDEANYKYYKNINSLQRELIDNYI